MRLRLFPKIALELSGLLLSDPGSDERPITAIRLQVVLQALPILQGRSLPHACLSKSRPLSYAVTGMASGAYHRVVPPHPRHRRPVGIPLGCWPWSATCISRTDGLRWSMSPAPAQRGCCRSNPCRRSSRKVSPGLSANVQVFGEMLWAPVAATLKFSKARSSTRSDRVAASHRIPRNPKRPCSLRDEHGLITSTSGNLPNGPGSRASRERGCRRTSVSGSGSPRVPRGTMRSRPSGRRISPISLFVEKLCSRTSAPHRRISPVRCRHHHSA